MISWRDALIYRVGRTGKPRSEPSTLADDVRENLLRDWAEGDRKQIARVTNAAGRDLAPREVDWSGMDPPPERRTGRPRTTGRGSGKQLLVRLSPEEYAAVAEAAGETSVATWARDAVLRAARR